jgi:hypothetical protein
MKEAKYYSKHFGNYGYIIRTMGSSEYKIETIEFTDEHNRKWIFKNRYSKMNNNSLLETEWKCIYDSLEQKGIISKLKKEK